MLNSLLNFSTNYKHHKLGDISGSFAFVLENLLNKELGKGTYRVEGYTVFYKNNKVVVNGNSSAESILKKLLKGTK